MTILFGDLLGVSAALLKTMLIYSLVSLAGLCVIARPLLFSALWNRNWRKPKAYLYREFRFYF